MENRIIKNNNINNDIRGPLCSGCECLIVDKYYLQTDDQVWHVSCLKCQVCQQLLDKSNTCYKRNGVFYCQEDYFRFNQHRNCAKCSVLIDNKELVMKVLDCVFHISCFNCGICGRILNSGEFFVIHENNLFCQDELRKTDPCHLFSGIQTDYRFSFEQNQAILDSIFIKTKTRRRIGDESDRLNIVSRQQDYLMMGIHKQKRLRTSFKHHQVRVMRTYFSLNHNPDTKDLKTLSEKTGLSKRVLQVWFQNARAKFRRSGLSKSDSNSQTNEDPLDSTLSYSDDTSSQEVINKDNDPDDR